MPSGPTGDDHTRIKQWMVQNFGPGAAHHEGEHDVAFIYRHGPFTLEITQEAFDHDGTATILDNLDRENVAARLRGLWGGTIHYRDGGVIDVTPS